MTLDLKIPPLAVGLIIAAAMWGLAWATPELSVAFPARGLVAGSVAAVGAFIILLGIASFWRAKTTVNPMQPQTTSSLVTTGIYTLTRNPMYLGFLLLLLAWAIFLSNAAALFALPLFVIYMNKFQIEPEERALDSLFNEQYRAYTSRVRRWI